MILDFRELVIISIGLVLIWCQPIILTVLSHRLQHKNKHLDFPLLFTRYVGFLLGVLYVALIVTIGDRNDAERLTGNVPYLVGGSSLVLVAVFLLTSIRQYIWDWMDVKTEGAISKLLDQESKSTGPTDKENR